MQSIKGSSPLQLQHTCNSKLSLKCRSTSIILGSSTPLIILILRPKAWTNAQYHQQEHNKEGNSPRPTRCRPSIRMINEQGNEWLKEVSLDGIRQTSRVSKYDVIKWPSSSASQQSSKSRLLNSAASCEKFTAHPPTLATLWYHNN